MRPRSSQVPWRRERDARDLLGWLADALAGASRPAPALAERARLARWLERHDLAAPAYATLGRADSELAERLRPAALSTAAWNGAQFDALDRIEAALGAVGIPAVRLKGAALARSAWGDPSRRPMSDLDLWVGPSRIEDAVRALDPLGYGAPRRAGDEVQLRPVGRGRGLVELHETAFRGAWVRWTTAVDERGVWSRASRRLAAEDEILHLACHLVVNHLDQSPLRALLDVGLVARTRDVDWSALAGRATDWRVATAAWLVLDLTDRTLGVPGARPAIDRLAPAAPRRAALRRLARPAAILAGRVGPATRRAIPLLVTDRSRDLLRLARNALWPERSWIAARYGPGRGRLAHLRALVGPGSV